MLVRFVHNRRLEAIHEENDPGCCVCWCHSLFTTVPASAHHAMVVEFNLAKPITLKGTLTKMEWVNPHGWIYVDSKGPGGRVESWKIETGSPFRMEKRGLKKTDFTIGDEVIVSGFASKDGTPTAAGMRRYVSQS